ncbi:Guanylate cyclase 32E [Eumeta japonica]|uniref:Guanylate cyclase 32E n=1 Tax=Eumeta variegata TaxID=151549 RepID=A0A4C1VIW6_EUMVA|nr:Guanylate cyclase 32E [Eumeta japonica]
MMRELSAEPPFCVPNYHRIFESITRSGVRVGDEGRGGRVGSGVRGSGRAKVPIEAAHLYDAVGLWARAATAALRAGVPPTDGALLMKLLRPTTYRSVQGFDVSERRRPFSFFVIRCRYVLLSRFKFSYASA